MKRGYIRMYRKIRDNFLWQRKPFSYIQAWIDLVMMANHKDDKLLLGGELIHAKRGEVITSQIKLAKRWGWSRGAVRRFLKLLEGDQMIVQKPTTKMTMITICNYDVYQDARPTRGTTDGQHAVHNEYTKEELKNNWGEIVLKELGENFAGPVGEWLAYKKQKRQPYTGARTIELLCREIRKLSGGDLDTARGIIYQSMGNGHTGLYALKHKEPEKPKRGFPNVTKL